MNWILPVVTAGVWGIFSVQVWGLWPGILSAAVGGVVIGMLDAIASR